MSNLSRMLTIHNFLSAATGIALAFALFRGFARKSAAGIGNFSADVTRMTLYLLLPLCIVYSLFLIASGVPQTLAGSVDIATLEGARQADDIMPGSEPVLRGGGPPPVATLSHPAAYGETTLLHVC